MTFDKQGPSLHDIREMDMVDYLASLGHFPQKIRQPDYWYRSPLREEKVASFKVNRKLNRWYDHGMGKGGNLIDFAILYNNCTVGELLKNFSEIPAFHQPVHQAPQERAGPDHKIRIFRELPLSSLSLLRYLHQRRIPLEIADRYCKEVRYTLGDKKYYGIGFKNDSGGYEIRNPYVKAGSSPKDITTLTHGATETMVFEGFMDFLSFQALQPKQSETMPDYLILNSVSFFERARPFMEAHESIRLYLDRDDTGVKYSRYALSLSQKYRDESRLYEGYKDLNDWVMNFGKTKKKKCRLRLG